MNLTLFCAIAYDKFHSLFGFERPDKDVLRLTIVDLC